MKVRKRALILFAAFVMLFSLCACNVRAVVDWPFGRSSEYPSNSGTDDSSDQFMNSPLDTVRVWQENYDTGFEALLDGAYADAVDYFQAAVNADPTLDLGYIALADSTAIVTQDARQVRAIFQEGLANASRTRILKQHLHDFETSVAEMLADTENTYSYYISNGVQGATSGIKKQVV